MESADEDENDRRVVSILFVHEAAVSILNEKCSIRNVGRCLPFGQPICISRPCVARNHTGHGDLWPWAVGWVMW